jgi:hypothetical protein
MNECREAQLVSGFVNLRLQMPFRIPIWVVAGLSSFVILCARSAQSMGRLPAYPGYGYVSEAIDRGVWVMGSGDPYYHVAARAIALVVSWFPLASQAIVMALLVHVVWSLCAAIIAVVTHRQSGQIIVGIVSGLCLVLVPHASESGIGNVGNVKWPLLAALVVTCASTKLQAHDIRWIAPLVVITGLTQPIIAVALLPIVIRAVAARCVTKTDTTISLLIAGSIALQIQRVGFDTATTGQSTKITGPWDGMGLFWWSGIAAPVLISVAVIVICVILWMRSKQQSAFIYALGLMTVVIAGASYWLGGIADRYFIVPMTLALITALHITLLLAQLFPKLRLLLICALGIGVLVPTAKWFSTGWYMTSGPTWRDEIVRARSLCTLNDDKIVELTISPNGTVELRCDVVLDG